MPYRRFFEEVCSGVESGTDGWFRCWCPLHEDPASSKSKSFAFNPSTGGWKCFSQCGSGGAVDLYGSLKDPAYNKSVDWSSMGDEFFEKYPETKVAGSTPKKMYVSNQKRLPSVAQIESWNEKLLESATQLDYLVRERGISIDVLREEKIGWDGERYTIPVFSRGNLIALRRYNPDTKFSKAKAPKFLGTKGDKVCFFPTRALEGGHQDIFIVEGEPDCLMLRSRGYNAVTLTGGAGTFPEDKTMPLLAFSRIFVVYDSDDAGRKGSSKVTKTLRSHGFDNIKNVDLMGMPDATEDEDLTDIALRLGDDFKQRFEEVVNNAPWCGKNDVGPSVGQVKAANQSAIYPAKYQQAIEKTNRENRLSVDITVLSVAPVPVECPVMSRLECTSGKQGAKKECRSCPINQSSVVVELKNAQMVADELLGRSSGKKDIKDRYDIGCMAFRVDTEEYGHFHHALIAPPNSREADFKKATTMTREAYIEVGRSSGDKVPPDQNSTQNVTMEQFRNPKNNEVCHLVTDFKPIKRAVDKFIVDDDFKETIKLFQADDIEGKLDDIYSDFEQHVIGHEINRSMLFGLDMVFHSVDEFVFDGKPVSKGQMEMLLIGDTRIGKTHSSKMLIEHYQRGGLLSGDNASEAGLFGGVDEAGTSGRRYVKCGVVPLLHRELVVLDEANELSREIIGRLSWVRSEGVYKITKIASAEIPCKLRMIWIANPRSTKSVSQYTYGIETVPEVIGKPEDIARFDCAFVMSKLDIDLDKINVRRGSLGDPKYPSEECSRMVDWAWSRKRSDIVFLNEALDRTLYHAVTMGERYHESIPLVVSREQRIKIARTSAALAARLGSTDEGFEKVIVTRNHVDVAVKLLCSMFDSKSTAYDRYSYSKSSASLDDEARAAANALGRKLCGVCLNNAKGGVRKTFFKDICGDAAKGEEIWGALLRGSGIEDSGRGYQFTSAFMQYMKKVKDDPNVPMSFDVERLSTYVPKLEDKVPSTMSGPSFFEEVD